MTTTPEELRVIVRAAVAAFERLTPEQQAAHLRAQAESWVRGEMELGRTEREETRRFLDKEARDVATDHRREGFIELQPAPESYRPSGAPLTDYERELLVILAEECAEVVQAATKLIRFGKENRPDSGVSNTDHLGVEIGELRAVISYVENAGLSNLVKEHEGRERKNKRLSYFMQTRKP